MKIVDFKTTVVTVPMEAPLRWSLGVETGTTRTVVEVITDEGIVGLGETYGGNATVRSLEFLRPMLKNTDPFEIEKILKKLQVFCISYETFVPAHAVAAVEMACWDIMGKALNRPVCSLLGGKFRDEVQFAGYVFFRYPSPDGKCGEDTPEKLLVYTEALVEKHKFDVLKIKGGALPPEQELEAVRLIRKRFPKARLRFDPNAAWSVGTAINTLRKMSEYDLEYAEDPTWGIEGMSLVRKDVPVPFATNMCVINFDQIPLGVRTRCVDIILSDVHYWGGLASNKKLAGVCETFQIGLGMHSDRELGISTAAQIHLAAALPYMTYAPDSHYHHQVDDIITDPFRYRDGCFKVPDAPGLGVELDPEKLKKYHRYHEEKGEAGEFLDPFRPKWSPTLPLW
ncbi:MAG TPA: enolase C-terminal domain-like protein [Candidatus Dormibacteraeota bacterium]|nr:enolase C-terminal domain-like protein [Candidatus Dormibacteraeota bacterium]